MRILVALVVGAVAGFFFGRAVFLYYGNTGDISGSQGPAWLIGVAAGGLIAFLIGNARAARITLGIIVGAVAGSLAAYATALGVSENASIGTAPPLAVGAAVWIGVAVLIGRRR